MFGFDFNDFDWIKWCNTSFKDFLGYLNYIFFQDITKLTPLSPEVISRQATINIGTIGHVAHGKSTVVKAISGVQTVRFKNELERNITIKLGKSFVCFVVVCVSVCLVVFLSLLPSDRFIR